MKKILSIFRYILVITCILLSSILIKVVNDLDILPSKYYVLLISILAILNILGIICMFTKKVWTKVIGVLLYIIVIIISLFGIRYGNKTIEFFDEGFNNDLKETTIYSVVVLKDSNYKKISDLKDKSMGYLVIENKSIKEFINNKVSSNFTQYKEPYTLYEDLINKKIDSIIIDNVYIDLLEDDYHDINDKIKIVKNYDITLEDLKEDKVDDSNSNSNDNSNNNDDKDNNDESNSNIVKDKYKSDNGSINIYISGSDSRSNTIKSKSRTDVNMIMTINPNTKTILLTSIPRDYYVRLHGTSGYKDKLTHSGIYGIDMSRKTLEDLLGIKIDYTIKVGFNSVIKIVNLVGGVDVYSNYSFTSSHRDANGKRFKVNKGWNHFDGARALAYSRERYAYKAGDNQRIKNQQQVLEAIIKKVSKDKSILLKYEEFLNSFKSLYKTDIPDSIIKKYIKAQLNDMSSWNIMEISLTGSGSYKRTYSMPGRNLYVMVPNTSSVNNASNKIKSVMKGN